MSATPSNSSSIQIPIRIHPRQPGTLRSDTGIQTGSNIVQDSSASLQKENNSIRQTNVPIIPQISNQPIQYRANQPSPIFHVTQGAPKFNTNLNTYDGVPIPPVLRPYQPPESKVFFNDKDLNSNKTISQIYACRQNNDRYPTVENEYLCSFSDSPSIQYAKWISQSQIYSDPNYLQKIRDFNESNFQSIFLNITSSSKRFQNNAMSPVEIICQFKNHYLIRYKLNDLQIFCWDHGPFNDFYEDLIKSFQNKAKIQRKAPNITNGVKLILDSIQKQLGLIFCGEKNDIIEFLSVYTGKVLLVTEETDFSWWCTNFEEKCLSYVGYRGDDFSRAIIRQFQITSRTVLLLMTYNSAITDFSFFSDLEFDCLVADNGERLKNRHGRKRSALQSINCKYRIVLTSKLKVSQLQSIQEFVQNDEVIYFKETKNITKYIFVRPTDYQLALLASNPYEADKICQNGYLINPKSNINEIDQRINMYEKYSSKFLFIGKVSKNAKTKTAFIFKSRKVLNLCKNYLDSIEISYKSPENVEAEALIALFFYNDLSITNYDIKICIDCNCTYSDYRLILYGTREHYFLAEKVQNLNIEKEPIIHVPSPPLISFDNNQEPIEFEEIVNTSASLVNGKVFDFQSLGISNFLDKKQIKSIIQEMCHNGFQFDNQPFHLSIGIALFRSINPEQVTKFPISFFNLVKESETSDISFLLSGTKKKWLKPIKSAYPTVDFTPFHELKKYFFKSSERILQAIEDKMIIMNFFKITNNYLKFDLLPPSQLSTPDGDKNLLISMQEGIFPISSQKRIDDIINIMRFELILNDFQEHYIFPFWTANEVYHIAQKVSDFGSFVPPQEIALLSKKIEDVENMKREITRQLINGSKSIRIPTIVNRNQKFEWSCIPQVVTIPEQVKNDLEIKFQLSKLLKTVLLNDTSVSSNEICKNDFFINSFIRTQKVELSADSCNSFFKGLLDFGVSKRSDLLLSPDFPFRATLTPYDVSLLDGKFAIAADDFGEEAATTKIPPCFVSDASLLSAVIAAIKESRQPNNSNSTIAIANGNGNNGNGGEYDLQSQIKQQQRNLVTMPIGVQPIVSTNSASSSQATAVAASQKQPQQSVASSRNYSPPNELLQRAADLQNQKRFEKKKMKQMKPIISVMPNKKQPQIQQQIQIGQPHFMAQQPLPLPISQPQPQQQQIQQQQIQQQQIQQQQIQQQIQQQQIQQQQQQIQQQIQTQQPQIQQQSLPQQQMYLTVKTPDDKSSIEESQKQQKWTTHPFCIPNVELGRKTADNVQPDSMILPPKKRPISIGGSPPIHQPPPQLPQPPPQPQIDPHQVRIPPVSTPTAGVVEPLKTAHVRMTQAAARQMINDDFLKSLPHTTRQQGQNYTSTSGSSPSSGVAGIQPPSPPAIQQPILFQTAQPQISQSQPPTPPKGNDIQTNPALLPLKKKHLANSPK